MDETCECGAKEGQLHKFGCRFERCPFCEEIAGSGCNCAYELLGLRRRDNPPEFDWLPERVYKRGLTPAQQRRWLKILTTKGRLPFVSAPQLCGRCGELWPVMFIVQDSVWEYYTGPELRSAVLCEPCFHRLRKRIDRHQPRPGWLAGENDVLRFIEAWRLGDRDTLRELEPQKFEPGYPGVPNPSLRRTLLPVR
jgi:hypothetical protein